MQKRANLGASVGPNSAHLGKDDIKLIEKCVVRHDRANDPKDISSCIEIAQDLNPNLSSRQEGDQWRKLIWRKNEALKHLTVIAQATITKCSSFDGIAHTRRFYNFSVNAMVASFKILERHSVSL